MSDLRPCPRCSRHADASELACPFCHADLAGAVPGKLRLVSRRELTRLAIFAGAAALAGACGSSSAPADDLDEPDDSSGGESEDGTSLSHASDDGSGRSGGSTEETEAEAEAQRRALEEQQLLLQDPRRRHRPRCTPEGLCPPYGAPPLPDALV